MFLIQSQRLAKRKSIFQTNQLAGKEYSHQHFNNNNQTHIKPQSPQVLKHSTTFSMKLNQHRPGTQPQQSRQLIKENKVTTLNKPIQSNSIPLKIGSFLINNQQAIKNISKFKSKRKQNKVLIQKDEKSMNRNLIQQISNLAMGRRKKMLKRKLAFNPAFDTFYSPFVDVIIIDQVKRFKDIEKQSIRMKFENIYKKLIRHQLTGEFTANFMHTIEKYIRQIVDNDELYINPFQIQLESIFKAFSRKEELIDAINRLESNEETFQIFEIVKFYCVPSQETCYQILKKLIDHLVVDLYQNKNCKRDIEYVLLNEQGKIINHISEIYFSTLQLYITPKATAQKSYQLYKQIAAQSSRVSRLSLQQILKNDFIEKIVKDKIEHKIVNYHRNVNEYKETRKQLLRQAENILDSKSKARIKTRRQRQKFDDDKESKSLVLLRQKQEEASHKDDLYFHYLNRKRSERLQYANILEKLHRILDPKKQYAIKSRMEQNTQREFKLLYPLNQKYDITFNHQHPDKVLVQNILSNCSLFSNKPKEQINKIQSLFRKVYHREKESQFRYLFYWEFKEIFETAHGVSSKDAIMKLILNYFDFDEFGQLSKKEFDASIDICLSLYGRSISIIKYTLWNYFQSIKIIENNYILKKNLQIEFQPHRIIFLLLVSIIFGSEYASIEEMLAEILGNSGNDF